MGDLFPEDHPVWEPLAVLLSADPDTAEAHDAARETWAHVKLVLPPTPRKTGHPRVE